MAGESRHQELEASDNIMPLARRDRANACMVLLSRHSPLTRAQVPATTEMGLLNQDSFSQAYTEVHLLDDSRFDQVDNANHHSGEPSLPLTLHSCALILSRKISHPLLHHHSLRIQHIASLSGFYISIVQVQEGRKSAGIKNTRAHQVKSQLLTESELVSRL